MVQAAYELVDYANLIKRILNEPEQVMMPAEAAEPTLEAAE